MFNYVFQSYQQLNMRFYKRRLQLPVLLLLLITHVTCCLLSVCHVEIHYSSYVLFDIKANCLKVLKAYFPYFYSGCACHFKWIMSTNSTEVWCNFNNLNCTRYFFISKVEQLLDRMLYEHTLRISFRNSVLSVSFCIFLAIAIIRLILMTKVVEKSVLSLYG